MLFDLLYASRAGKQRRRVRPPQAAQDGGRLWQERLDRLERLLAQSEFVAHHRVERGQPGVNA